MHSRGRILHNSLEADAVAELLQAHRMSPWRAEPLVYLAWQYARRMQARPLVALLICVIRDVLAHPRTGRCHLHRGGTGPVSDLTCLKQVYAALVVPHIPS